MANASYLIPEGLGEPYLFNPSLISVGMILGEDGITSFDETCL